MINYLIFRSILRFLARPVQVKAGVCLMESPVTRGGCSRYSQTLGAHTRCSLTDTVLTHRHSLTLGTHRHSLMLRLLVPLTVSSVVSGHTVLTHRHSLLSGPRHSTHSVLTHETRRCSAVSSQQSAVSSLFPAVIDTHRHSVQQSIDTEQPLGSHSAVSAQQSALTATRCSLSSQQLTDTRCSAQQSAVSSVSAVSTQNSSQHVADVEVAVPLTVSRGRVHGDTALSRPSSQQSVARDTPAVRSQLVSSQQSAVSSQAVSSQAVRQSAVRRSAGNSEH